MTDRAPSPTILVMSNNGSNMPPAARSVLIWSVVVNLAMSGVKAGVGLATGSPALTADAVHSLTDLVSDGVVWLGVRLGRAEPDEAHPFGHGRIETLAALIVAVIMVIGAIGLAWSAGAALVHGDVTPAGGWAVIVAAASVLAKEILYQWTVRVARRLNSQALAANAWHHRSDALSSVAVVLGVGAAWLDPRLAFLDPAAALIVSGLILKVGWDLGQTGILEIIDTAADREVTDRLAAYCLQAPGVKGVHDCHIRRSGGNMLMRCHILVDGEVSLKKAHAMATAIEILIKSREPEVIQVDIHVEPYSQPQAQKD